MMRRLGLLLLLGVLSGGCWSDEGLGERPLTPVKAPERSLYERLGKEEGIARIVDEWMAQSVTDPRVNFVHKGTDVRWTPTEANLTRLKTGMVKFLCERTGGPLRYDGRDMKSVHQGMQISGGEFDAMKKDLKDTLKLLKVKEKEQNELFKVVESVRRDIVEVP
jgi:hemoglobin